MQQKYVVGIAGVGIAFILAAGWLQQKNETNPGGVVLSAAKQAFKNPEKKQPLLSQPIPEASMAVPPLAAGLVPALFPIAQRDPCDLLKRDVGQNLERFTRGETPLERFVAGAAAWRIAENQKSLNPEFYNQCAKYFPNILDQNQTSQYQSQLQAAAYEMMSEQAAIAQNESLDIRERFMAAEKMDGILHLVDPKIGKLPVLMPWENLLTQVGFNPENPLDDYKSKKLVRGHDLRDQVMSGLISRYGFDPVGRALPNLNRIKGDSESLTHLKDEYHYLAAAIHTSGFGDSKAALSVWRQLQNFFDPSLSKNESFVPAQ